MQNKNYMTHAPVIASGVVGIAALLVAVFTLVTPPRGLESEASIFGGTFGTGTTFNRNYVTGSSFGSASQLECDVYPRGNADGRITKEDYDLIGQFSVGNQVPSAGTEFQKADCAPKSSKGDGKVDVSDWVQAGRYWQGLDPVQTVGGPTTPAVTELEGDVWPRPNGDGVITQEDYDLTGQFSVGNTYPEFDKEFQRADTAPKDTKGDGQITVADWVQTGRYWQGLDPVQTVGGPTSSQ